MLILEFLKDLGNVQGYSRKSKIILFAYYLRQYQAVIEFGAVDIKQCFIDALIKPPSDLNKLLKVLAKGKDSPFMRAKRSGRYSLTLSGLNEVEEHITSKQQQEVNIDSYLTSTIPYLKKVISKVSEENQRKFMAESTACLGVDAKRASIIMTWAGAIAHLYDYILAHKLGDFNTALGRRGDKYGKLTISTYDDFSDIPESVFIEVCRSARIISNDVKKILEEKLGIRNTCAHPSGVEIHRTKVVNFIEDLVDNVVVKYKI